MRLRTFESFWLLKNGLLYTYPLLQKNLRTEIVVVGGGITGALISHAILNAGYDVTLIDRRDIGQGSTAATTSMLQYEIDTPLYELAEMIGEDDAARCYQAGVRAIKSLKKLIVETKIDCGFKMKKSLYIAHNAKSAARLRREFALRDKHKLGVQWLTETQVQRAYGIVSYGAILSDIAASIDAYKLAHELIALNVRRGLKVYDQTAIKRFRTHQSKPEILTANGCTITAKRIIFCAGFESTQLLKENVAELIYTYACVSEQCIKLNPNLNDVLVWDTNDPYLYLRTTDDGRMLVGGEDSPFQDTILQQEIKERKATALIRKLKKTIPKIDFIEDFSWGGVFGKTKDGLPYIGTSPEHKNALFVLGFGGNGITFSAQGMEIIPQLLRNEEHELAHYYRFGREL